MEPENSEQQMVALFLTLQLNFDHKQSSDFKLTRFLCIMLNLPATARSLDLLLEGMLWKN